MAKPPPVAGGQDANAPSQGAIAASPSRATIIEALRTAPAGLTAAELAERTGLHHNGVRRHLGRLADAGAISSELRSSGGRGRPARVYSFAAEGLGPRFGERELVRMLAEVIDRCSLPADELDALGAQHGRRLVAEGPVGRTSITSAIANMGFSPEDVGRPEDAKRGRLSVRLGNCPFRDAVKTPNGRTVCELHRAMVAGMADAGGGRLTEFDVREPDSAGCGIRIEGLRPDPAVFEEDGAKSGAHKSKPRNRAPSTKARRVR